MRTESFTRIGGTENGNMKNYPGENLVIIQITIQSNFNGVIWSVKSKGIIFFRV